jgi:SEC-C motif domain protein
VDGARRAGHDPRALFDQDGVVEFRAHYVAAAGPGAQHERSRFARRDGRWFYVDGVSLP